MRARATLRRRWASTVVVTCIVAVVTGTVLALGAGARRTGSAPDRYTQSIGGDVGASLQQRSGPPLTEKIEALPGVEAVSAYTFLFAGFEEDGTHTIPENFITFAGTRPLTSRIVAGRDTDPARPHEFVADKRTVTELHAHIGDHFRFKAYSRSQQGFSGDPKGTSFDDAVLVGVIDSPDKFESNFTVAIFPASLLDEDVGFVATLSLARLAPHVSPQKLREEIDKLPGGKEVSVDAGRVISSDVRNAVDAQSQGIWVMAAVLALAALIALGQLLTRHVRLADHERVPLHAVGFTSRQLTLESLVRAAVPAGCGIVFGAALAVSVSGRFPTGFAREIEPHPGVAPDAVALVVGSGLLLLALLVWVAVAFTIANRARSRAVAGAGLTFTARAPSPAAAIGTRFALTRRDGSSASAIGTIAVLAVIIAALVGTTAFATSLDHLVTDRDRFGQNYTFTVGNNDGSDHSPAELRTALAHNPDIAGMMILSESSVRVRNEKDHTFTVIDLIGVERVKGDLAPRILSGRMPSGPDELALGRITAHTRHLHVGSTPFLSGAKGSGTYRVVGIAVVPGIGGNDGVGVGAVMTGDGMRTLQPQTGSNGAALQLRAGAPRSAATGIAKAFGAAQAGAEEKPGVILNIARIKNIPAVLAVLLATLGLLTMLHALIVAIQQRRRDLAVLRALGADRRWISRTVHWQATVLTAIPLIVGVPLGIVAGATVFRAFVNRIGALPSPVVPTLLVVGIAVAMLVVANLAAVVPAMRARRLSTAELLRDE
jgi:ABC-type lipoprotein release transport system permease subunit